MNVAVQRRDQRTGNVERENSSYRRYLLPEADIREKKDSYILNADLPGVSRDGLEVTLEDNTLTIVGRRKEAHLEGRVLLRESQAADFRRVFELAPSIDTAKINAHIADGVLTLELPKAERVKPKKIIIKS